MTEAHDRSAGVLEKGGVVRFARDFFSLDAVAAKIPARSAK